MLLEIKPPVVQDKEERAEAGTYSSASLREAQYLCSLNLLSTMEVVCSLQSSPVNLLSLFCSYSSVES